MKNKRRWLAGIVAGMALIFAGSAMVSVAEARIPFPPCNKCIEEGCPSGHCYFDCEGCCYYDWRYGTVCYR